MNDENELSKYKMSAPDYFVDYNIALDCYIVKFDTVAVVLRKEIDLKSNKKFYHVASDVSRLNDSQINKLIEYQKIINNK